jgi:hypothetical protein
MSAQHLPISLRAMMLVVGPVIGVVSGIIIGLVAMLVGKLRSKNSSIHA